MADTRTYKHISHQLLEEDPEEYLSRIKTIILGINDYPEDMVYTVGVRKTLQDTSVSLTWYTNHVQSLSYLVGTQEKILGPHKIWHDYGYYGFGKEISEALGLEILECMAFFKPDMTIKNFYDQDIIESMDNTETCTHRKDNENFLKRVKELYIAPNSARPLSYFADIYNYNGGTSS